MTPEVLATIGSLAERYGLPLLMLGGVLYLFLTGRIVTAAQLKLMTTLFERERADRLAAEAIVAKFAPANAAVAESIEELASALLEGRPAPKRKREPYGERLEGNRGR